MNRSEVEKSLKDVEELLGSGETPSRRSKQTPDAIRHPDRSVVVQNIVIKPHNIEFSRRFTTPRRRGNPTEVFCQQAVFTELFSMKTRYEALDNRMVVTAAKHRDLLTILDHPDCPLH